MGAIKLLLDTHVWFWALCEPSRLGAVCRDALLDPAHELAVSVVSTLELARLQAQGRLDVGKDLARWTEEGLRACRAIELVLDRASAIEAYRLPAPIHQDPADRMLIAQARIHGLHLVTQDVAILAYPHVRSLDARV